MKYLSVTDIVTSFIAIVLLYIRPEYSLVIGCIVVKARKYSRMELVATIKMFPAEMFTRNLCVQ